MNKVWLRLKELVVILKLFVSYILSIFSYTSKKNIWIISERGTDARDNGYWLFKYIKENHHEINVRYIITRNSVDRKKLENYSDSLIDYGSWKHYYYLCLATCLISTHNQGYTPFMDFFSTINKKYRIWRNKKVVMLQHGIVKDLIPSLFYENTHIDLFIVGAKLEYNYMLKYFGYTEQQLKYTGLCRYDQLLNVSSGNYILIMPTWRSWLGKENFIDSEYFHKYKELLECSQLHEILKQNNVKIIFYPHYEIQVKYIDEFKKLNLNDAIIVADMNYDVQQLLKGTKLLITDYSSVFFDIAYMRKPIIFYQFDNERFFAEHYSKGYFDYKNSFGDFVTEQSLLITQIQRVIKNEYMMTENHKNKVQDFFVYHDTHNCKRVFNAIKFIKK